MTIARADFIEGIAKGMAVLESFDTERQRLNATLAAERAGLTRAAARRHLLTLAHLGYLETDGSYIWIAPKVLRFSGDVWKDHACCVTFLAERDANILFATDTPSSPTYGNLPGLNGYLEMQHLAEAGLSPAQVLRAATIHNARAFGMLERVGTIEPGKRADLLLLRDSPLDSGQAWDSIVTLWVGGRQVERSRLAAEAQPVKPAK